jgi:pilus assembly protein CpaE
MQMIAGATTPMLRAFVITPDEQAARHFSRTVDGVDTVKITRVFRDYPAAQDLVRLIHIYGPQLLFVAADDLAQFAAVVELLRNEAPGVRLVALHSAGNPAELLQLMQLGIQECLLGRFSSTELQDCLARTARQVADNPVLLQGTELVYSFLPAKPGVGATTLAVNASLAAARTSRKPVFLGDCDLNCGLVQFMLKLNNPHTLLDAAAMSADLDEDRWARLVTRIDTLDVIHAGESQPGVRLESLALQRLLPMLRRAYRIVCFDLSGNLEKYSIDLMHESRRIFLVTTPELPALHLARAKHRLLESIDLADRVTVLLNRAPKNGTLTQAQIEDLLGTSVHLSLPNDYQTVHKAVSEAGAVPVSTALGTQITQLAHYMINGTFKAESPTRKRMVEYFALVPSSFRMQRS